MKLYFLYDTDRIVGSEITVTSVTLKAVQII
jgi:hypothetical protein